MGQTVIPRELISKMYQGECALFLGYEGIIASSPPAPTFGEYLTDGYPRQQPSSSIFTLAQSYESEHGRHGLVRKLEKYLTYVLPSLEPIYHCLSQFSLPFIISTSVDTRMETILRNQGLRVLPVVRNEDVASAVNDEVIKVVKLFGSIEYPDTLVLTERDLIELPDKSSRIFDLVVTALATYPLLIVGHQLHDFHFRRLYRQLIHILGGQFQRSYALCSHPGEDLEYWQKENVQIISGNEERLLRYIAALPRRESRPVASRQPIPISGTAIEPYKFLDYFETEDADIFFGRKDDTNRCLQKVFSHRLTVLCGKSGVGKTSLIKAGISPLLNRDGRYRLIYTRCGDDPSSSVKRALIDLEPSLRPFKAASGGLAEFMAEARRIMGQELIILLDQFEEFFIKFGEEIHSHFLREMMQCLTSSSLTVRFVLSLREDYLSRLADLRDIVPIILYNVYRLKELSIENARDTIVEPARAFGIDFEDGLAEAILKDIGATEVAPPQIQIVCYKLYKSLGERTTITRSLYDRLGGIKQILSDYLEESLVKFEEKAELVKAVLKAMVTSEGTKSLLPLADISIRTGLDQVLVEQILDDLVNNQRLVRKVSGEAGLQFELAHEYLTFKIWQWFGEEEIRHKEIQELMERELNSWRRFRHLRLGKDKLDIFNKSRHALKLNNDVVELLLLSSIRHLEDCEYWLNWIRKMDVEQQDQSATSIMNIFSDSHWVLRRQAAEALAGIGTQPLLRVLDHHDPAWKCAAIEMIGGLETKEAVPSLLKALDDASVEVRALACGALGEIGKSLRPKDEWRIFRLDDNADDPIIKAIRLKLAPGEETLVRIAAIEALFQAAADKGVADWLPLLLDDVPEVVRTVKKKLKSLAYCRSEEWPGANVFIAEGEYYDSQNPAILGVVEALKSKNSKWRRKVAAVVATWEGCPRALSATLMFESDEMVLSRIIKLLERIDDPHSRPALIYLVQHARSPLREEAKRVLDNLHPPMGTYQKPTAALSRVNDMKQLIAHLGDKFLCEEAEDRLVRIGDAAVDKLIETLKHKEWRPRKHAASALGRIGDRRATPALEELVDDKDTRVAKTAQEAVLKFKPRSEVWMKDWQKSFRQNS